MWIWQAHASNNSGDWTIVGRFTSAEEARRAAESLRELSRADEAFLASPEGRQWLKENDYFGNIPSPPLRLFGNRTVSTGRARATVSGGKRMVVVCPY